MIAMRNENLPTLRLGQGDEGVEQDHGIHAAGNGDENFLSAGQLATLVDFGGDALEEFTHVINLPFFFATGKRRSNHGSNFKR